MRMTGEIVIIMSLPDEEPLTICNNASRSSRNSAAAQITCSDKRGGEQVRSVCPLDTLNLDRIAVNRAGDCDFLTDVPFDLRSIVHFQHLMVRDEDGSRAALHALRGAVLVLRARAFR